MHRAFRPSIPSIVRQPVRTTTHARWATTEAQKRAGDISDAFASLSGLQFEPLDPQYALLKGRLIKGNEDAVHASWERLLKQLREDIPAITALGSKIIPEIDFRDLDNPSAEFKEAYKNVGVAVVRQAIPEREALDMKQDLNEYIKANPQTKAFPSSNPQVYELYWSRSQLRARGHPNLLAAQRFLMSFWHSASPSAPISTRHPTSYADRLRMRQPGDTTFALGAHVDGGSVERWDESGYGLGKVYDAIWRGEWEAFDPWEASCRLPVVSDLHQGVGACSMFRMAQGWLSLSTTSAFEGTLLVNPLLRQATAYYLLRPFFTPIRPLEYFSSSSSSSSCSDPTSAFLSPSNWTLASPQNSWLHGASPGHGQELRPELHPHLSLPSTMTHIPRVNPGDYVAWHCDTIHAVDSVHQGVADSSVLYIPACPMTVENAKGLARQRRCFVNGWPSPDFGGGEGESLHAGRVDAKAFEELVHLEGRRAMGLEEWSTDDPDLSVGEREVLARANKVLGFYQ